jgi:hypothetical protein
MIAFALLFAVHQDASISDQLEKYLVSTPFKAESVKAACNGFLLKSHGGIPNDVDGLKMIRSGTGPTPSFYALSNFQNKKDRSATFRWMPIIVWKQGSKTRAQALQNEEHAEIPFVAGDAYCDGKDLLIVGAEFDKSGPGQSAMNLYTLVNGRWKGEKAMRSDHQGFALMIPRKGPGLPTVDLQSFDPGENLSSSLDGPQLIVDRFLDFENDSLKSARQSTQSTAYSALDDLAGFAHKNQRKQFNARVPRALQPSLWKSLAQCKSAEFAVKGERLNGLSFKLGSTKQVVTFAAKGDSYVPVSLK